MAGNHPPPPTLPGNRAEGLLLHGMRREVAALLQRGENTRFPGAQPVSFARRHLQELQRQDYYVCEKSDGIRCLMYLTNDGDFEVTYLIDRKNDYYHVPGLHFPRPESDASFYTNTIVDGELVNDREPDGSIQLRYLVFDCLVLDGKSLMHRTLDKRLAYFHDAVFNPYSALYKRFPEETQYRPFELVFKSMEFSYGIEMMFRDKLPNLPHGNDGLIFTCRNTPYCFGTDQHILKWKPAEENSIDFQLHLEIPLRELDDDDDDDDDDVPPQTTDVRTKQLFPDYDALPTFKLSVLGDGNSDISYSTMYVTSAEWERIKALNEPIDDRIVECYQDGEHRWRFMRFRDDKKDANHISTVESVIESIEDRIDAQILIGAAPAIKIRWKERQAKDKEAKDKEGLVMGMKRKTSGPEVSSPEKRRQPG